MATSLVRSFAGTDTKAKKEEDGFGLWREVDRVFDNIARSFGREAGRSEISKGFAGEVLAPSQAIPAIEEAEPMPVQAKTEILSPPSQPTPIRLNRAAPAANNGPMSPVADAYEDDDCFEVALELPGVLEADIDIEFSDGAISISAERRRPENNDDRKHQVRERTYGSFKRRFPLPFQANPDIIEAKYEAGIVTITVPKPPETKPRTKKIDLKTR
ncbi:MAG: Hsp20/alpha crystallin family protein [Alphaproteobacteria bacterium]|nr:Hsp20/alpha crystallin family protein [Alphaproteobacteria bacterium]